MSQLTKVDRLNRLLSTARSHARESARVGTNSLVTVAGGVATGWCNAKYEKFAGTEVSSAAVIGVGAVVAALSGIFAEYSDEAAAFGAGMLASLAAAESEKYFNE